MKSPWTRKHEQAIGALIPWSWIGGCVVLAAVVLLLLTGCASSFDHDLEQKASPHTVVVTWNKKKPAMCGDQAGGEACAWRTPDYSRCYIEMPWNASWRVIAEEFLHCFGWEHR